MSEQKNQKGKYRNYILAITGLAVFNFLFLGTEHYSYSQCSRISGLSDFETLSGKPTRNGYADYFRSDLYVKYLDDDR